MSIFPFDCSSIELLSTEHSKLLNDFRTKENDSGSDTIGDYLKYAAISDNSLGNSSTHIFIGKSENSEQILGFISLRSSSLVFDITDDGSKIGEPALEIYELGVHKDFQRLGIGTYLVKYAIGLAHKLNSEYTGIKHIVLCAVEDAQEFYSKIGFEHLRNITSIPRDNSNNNCIGMTLKLF